MEDLMRVLAQALVDYPQKVSVTTVKGNHTTILELQVAKSDTAKIIGKQGRTANALRTILGAVAAKERKRAVLEIIDTPNVVQDSAHQPIIVELRANHRHAAAR
jgi:uncharacterized protein